MAGGKMSARQKMINLMYLVFIAMLAMNMSKEVLSAFGFMNEKLVENNISTIKKNKEAYANLDLKASEQKEKFGPLKVQADKIKTYANDFYDYLAAIKSKMLTEIEDKYDYKAMDKTDWLDTYFFKGDSYTAEGQEFLDRINTYRTNVIEVIGSDSKFVNVLNKRFSTNPVIDSETEKEVPFLKARYEGFPMIASLTSFTQMQADIRNTESDIVTDLLGGKLEDVVSLNNYTGIVRLNKSAYFAGEKITGEVVLGRYDASLVPDKVILNGKDATDAVQNGQVILNMPAGNVGEKTIKGTIYFRENGEEVPVPFESKYSVIAEPSSAVVSADKMNVVYRGLDNPISVSLPGVGDNNIRVSVKNGNQIKSKGKGKYNLTPGLEDEVEISIAAKISPKKTIYSKKIFRIKTLPAPQGSIRGEFNRISMPSSSLPNIILGANYPDFMYDLKLKVISFKVAVPGEFAVEVKGDRMTAQAKKLLKKAKRGDKIDFFDIKAKIIENNYVLEKYCIDIKVIVDN